MHSLQKGSAFGQILFIHFYEREANKRPNEIENVEKKNKTKKYCYSEQYKQQHIASIFQHKTDLLNENVDKMKRLMVLML